MSDDVVELFAAIGRHDRIVGEIKRQFGGLVDVAADSGSYDIPGTLPADAIQDIQGIDTLFNGFAAQ